MTEVPNPGSDEALALGCKCPVLDNNHGKWPPGPADPERGIPEAWWFHTGCPLHGGGDWRDEPCDAVLHHGPGHQSRARCRLRGEHETHEAVYDGSTLATWTGPEATTGFFDEPPEADDG